MMPENKLTPSTVLDLPLLSRIVVGIGEVSNITGVSPRQLRYWESKGIISSMDACTGTNRKYNYVNIEKIVLVKDFLDQGYTLESAARRLEERIKQLNSTIVKLSSMSYANSGDTLTENSDYVLIGLATHCQTREKLKIYSPLNGSQEEWLAQPFD